MKTSPAEVLRPSTQPSVLDWDLESVLEAFASGVFLFDSQANLVAMNREAERIFGLRSLDEAADEFAGRSHTVRVRSLDGRQLDEPHAYIERALRGAVVVDDFERVAPLDGARHAVLRVTIRPVVNRNGQVAGVLKVVDDVTTEYELAQREEEFICVASHELRTPATVLRLAARRVLGCGPLDPADLRKTAEQVDRATRRIEGLATKLSDMATVARGGALAIKPTIIELGDLAADAIASLDEEQSSRVHLTRAPARVRADAMRVREVLDALLDNAFRYSVAPAPVEIRLRTFDRVVDLSVEDHGIGIPTAKQPYIFDQFYRAHTSTPFDRGGLGANLYLASHIMKQHGGRIWFESSEMGGTVFHLAFPVEPGV